jgi:hypothetical protein
MVARRGSLGDSRAKIPFWLCLAAAFGCASPGHKVTAADAPGSVRRKQSVPAEAAAPPAVRLELSVDEELMSARLKKTTGELCALGERNQGHPWELADAAEYVGQALNEIGASSRRYTLEHDGVVYHSFVLELGGEGQPFEVVAFYDSELSASVNPRDGLAATARGALGTATALELARIFVPAHLDRPLRLVLSARPPLVPALDEGYSPSASPPLGRLVLGDGLGAPELALGGQGVPAGEWPQLLVDALDEPPLAPRGAVGPAAAPEVAPLSLSLTLTGSGTGADNFDLTAMRVSKIRAFLAMLLGEKPTNDQMLTPR